MVQETNAKTNANDRVDIIGIKFLEGENILKRRKSNMKVRLNMTNEQELEFESWLKQWQVPKGKWLKREGSIYEGGLEDMEYDGNVLWLIGFRCDKFQIPSGTNAFDPEGRVIFAGIETKDGWKQIYSSCLHQQARKEEIDFWSFGHSSRQIKYLYICSCGAEWTEWEWA